MCRKAHLKGAVTGQAHIRGLVETISLSTVLCTLQMERTGKMWSLLILASMSARHYIPRLLEGQLRLNDLCSKATKQETYIILVICFRVRSVYLTLRRVPPESIQQIRRIDV